MLTFSLFFDIREVMWWFCTVLCKTWKILHILLTTNWLWYHDKANIRLFECFSSAFPHINDDVLFFTLTINLNSISFQCLFRGILQHFCNISKLKLLACTPEFNSWLMVIPSFEILCTAIYCSMVVLHLLRM